MSSDSFSPVESNFGVFAKKYSISLFMEFIKKVIITHDFNISYFIYKANAFTNKRYFCSFKMLLSVHLNLVTKFFF